MLDDAGIARVGPNALIQMDAALIALAGDSAAARVFAAAGLTRDPPDDMVPETAVRVLFEALKRVREDDWPEIAAEAGRRTADYILANRIPRPAQRLLRLLPHRMAAPILAGAIARHAWTFCGSAGFTVDRADGLRLIITHNTLAMPGCPWHRAVFDRLFTQLSSPACSVHHDACCAAGDAACVFTVARGA